MASKWEPHKRRIKELYLGEDKTIKEVQHEMEMNSDFSASIPEYERQLKKWNFKKNLKQPDLKFIKTRLEMRKAEGVETEIYHYGTLMRNIQKRAQRCFVTYMERQELVRSRTPPGLVFMTPRPDLDLYMKSVRTSELPWNYFRRQLDSIQNLAKVIEMPGTMLRAMLPAITPDPSPLVPKHLQQIVHTLNSVMPVNQDDEIIQYLNNIFGGDDFLATREFLKLAVYLVSNKLLDKELTMSLCNGLVKWFQNQQNHSLLRSILSSKLPTIEAFAESLFESALYSESETILRMFLQSGLSPDIIIRDAYGLPEDRRCAVTYLGPCKPLQYLAQLGNTRLIELFLEKRADIHGIARPSRIDFGGRTPLQIAAEHGKLEAVKLLIDQRAAVNIPANYGTSALQYAALAGSFEISSLLLQHGASIDANFGKTSCALSCAIQKGQADLAHMLIREGADVNCHPGDWGRTPLQSAACAGDHDMVKFLLGRGADVNSPAAKCRGRTCLQGAAENGDLELCRILLQAGADVNALPATGGVFGLEKGITALSAAIFSENYELVSLLVKEGANVNDLTARFTKLNDVELARRLLSYGVCPNELIRPAIEAGKLEFELVKLLVEAGACLNTPGMMTAAVGTKDLQLIQYLLCKGACPNTPGLNLWHLSCTPILLAVEIGSLPIIELLLKSGALIEPPADTDARSPLEMACENGNIELVKYLLDAGADLHRPAGRHRTALQAATWKRDFELVELLISEGANPNAAAGAGGLRKTALQEATVARNIGLVQLLLNAGADVDGIPEPKYGLTPLQEAAFRGDEDLIHLLLEHGANVNWAAAPFEGLTALQAAASRGHHTTVKFLIENGANVNAPASESSGYTALQAAAKGGYIRIANLLLARGAVVDAPGSIYSGYTALESAAACGRIDMLKVLLNAGADITKTETGRCQLRRALKLAIGGGHNAAAKFLECHQIV